MADIISLSEARAKRQRQRFRAVGTNDPALGAWFSRDYARIMGLIDGPGSIERVTTTYPMLPCDVEPQPTSER